jgi:natural product biosynthesis luciferase-like monooxygenase protein
MKFSLFHLPSFFPQFHRSEAQFYEDMLHETETADTYGFHSAWFAEHHFHPYGGHIPSVPVLGAAVAQRTKNIRIGSGIALLPLQDPIRLAEEYAMLDCLSGGRLEFGIGRGFQKMEYDAFQRDMGDSRVLFEEAHDIILNAWTKERFSYVGKFRTVHNLRVLPKPIQKLPPIYVACIFTPDSFQWTGKMGYNLMVVPYAASAEFIIDRINFYQDARAAHGHTAAPEILGVYHFYCGETADKAKEEPREALMRYVGLVVAANQEAAYSDQYAVYKTLPEAFADMKYEGYLYPNRVIIGDPDQCVERIQQIRSMGITNISLLPNFGGLDHTKVMASLDRFAKYVMPKCSSQ